MATGLLRREALDDTAHVAHVPFEGDPVRYSYTALSEVPDSIDLLLVDYRRQSPRVMNAAVNRHSRNWTRDWPRTPQ